MIFALNASGFRSKILEIVSALFISFSLLFLQFEQWQFIPQYSPRVKHSQYNLRHYEFLQEHPFFSRYYIILLLAEFSASKFICLTYIGVLIIDADSLLDSNSLCPLWYIFSSCFPPKLTVYLSSYLSSKFVDYKIFWWSFAPCPLSFLVPIEFDC